MFSYKVLSPGQLKALERHKYASTNKSLVEPVLRVFWKWLILKFPLWIAPNVLTMIGFTSNFALTLMLLLLDPKAVGEGPRWIFLLPLLGIFLQQTMDALDGEQSRRTGVDTYLEEVFDHGCDIISALLMGLSCGSPAYLGKDPAIFAVIVFTIMALFYLTHWQAYVCGKVIFRRLDVTEAQIFVMSIHLMTFLFGIQFWENVVFGLTVRTILLTIVLFAISLAIVLGALNVITGGVGKNGTTVANTNVLSPGIPLALVFYFSWSFLKRSDALFHHWPSLTLFVLGLPIVKLIFIIQVAKMVRMPMPLFDRVLLCPMALWISSYLPKMISDQDVVILLLMLVYLLASNLVLFTSFCQQTNAHFGRSCFSIPYPPRPPTEPTIPAPNGVLKNSED